MIEPREEPKPAHHRTIHRGKILRHLQRSLVPFLSAVEIHERLAEIEAAQVLRNWGSGAPTAFEQVPILNACLFEHPTFFKARELRTLQDEHLFWGGYEDSPGEARYRIEQRVTVVHQRLLDDGFIRLWLPAPREVPGVQRVRLLAAEPEILAEHYLPTAGQIYAAPLLVTPGRALPLLRLEFEVERMQAPHSFVRDVELPKELPAEDESAAATKWLKKLSLKRPTSMTTEAFIDLLVDQMEQYLKFAISARNSSPVRTLVESGMGDVLMHTQLLAVALSSFGISTRLGKAQRLMLSDRHSILRYPESTGFDHVFLEWRDTARDEAGFVDLSYLERWCYAATEANMTDDVLRAQLEMLGGRAKKWLRRKVYPMDLVLAGSVPQSQMYSFGLYEGCTLYPPVDVELEAWRLQ
jgi:hypothetical protein